MDEIHAELTAINSRLDALSDQIELYFRLAGGRLAQSEAETDARFRRNLDARARPTSRDCGAQYASNNLVTAFGGVAVKKRKRNAGRLPPA